MKIKFANATVLVGVCKTGTVVQTSTFDFINGVQVRVPDPKGFAHIVGFGYNAQDELLIKIKTPHDKVYDQHPSGLFIHLV